MLDIDQERKDFLRGRLAKVSRCVSGDKPGYHYEASLDLAWQLAYFWIFGSFRSWTGRMVLEKEREGLVQDHASLVGKLRTGKISAAKFVDSLRKIEEGGVISRARAMELVEKLSRQVKDRKKVDKIERKLNRRHADGLDWND